MHPPPTTSGSADRRFCGPRLSYAVRVEPRWGAGGHTKAAEGLEETRTAKPAVRATSFSSLSFGCRAGKGSRRKSPYQCIDIIRALRPDGRDNTEGMEGLHHIASNGLLLVVQKCVSLCLGFRRAGGSRVAQSPKIRENIVFLRGCNCLENSLGALAGLGIRKSTPWS